MVKILIFFLLLFLSNISLFSQNLVKNNSFENYYRCPTNFSQINFVYDWNKSSKSSDYYNECNNTLNDKNKKQFGFKNICGYQLPHSGKGYAGFIPINEFLQTKLIENLEKDNIYFISFFISRADNTNATVSKIGAYFTKDAIGEKLKANSKLNFAIKNQNSFIVDTVNWIKISGFYKADKQYDYLIIGAFILPFCTDYIKDIDKTKIKGAADCYLYVDDISVFKLNLNSNIIIKGQNAYLDLDYLEFELNKYNIQQKYYAKLDNVISFIKQNPFIKISIYGYTDNTGANKINKQLAYNRANAIKNYLLLKGIDRNRIIYCGKGKDNTKSRTVIIELI